MVTQSRPRADGKLQQRPSNAVNGARARKPPRRQPPESRDDLIRQVRSRMARGYPGPNYLARLQDAKQDVWWLLVEVERSARAAGSRVIGG